MTPTLAATAADPALRGAFLGMLRSLAAAHGLDPEDLEQQVWLRAAAEAPVSHPGARLRALTIQEFRAATAEAEGLSRAREAAERQRGSASADATCPERRALAAEQARELRAAIARLPSRCPGLMAALLESPPLSYRELSEDLSMPRGSIGPVRARCLACLRHALRDVRTWAPPGGS